MKITSLLVVFLFISVSLCAQDPHFSQFFSSPSTLNPAYTGKFDGELRIAVNHRDQWPSIPKAFVTTSASVDFPILKSKIPEGDRFGIGFSGLTDASANNQLKLNYGSASLAYHKSIDENGYKTIGAGFQVTYSTMSLDISKLTFEDMLRQNGFTGTTGDVFVNGNQQKYFDVNAGVLFSGSTDGANNYYFGVSVYHVNKPKVSFKDNLWRLGQRFNVHGGGYLPVNDMLTFFVSGMYQQQSKASETILGAALGINAGRSSVSDKPTTIYLGSWYRLNDALIPYLGLEVGSFRIGASYDVNISSLNSATASRGGSEFSLIYIHKKVDDKTLPCPKF